MFLHKCINFGINLTMPFRNIGAREARLQYIIMPGASSDEFFRHLSRLLRHGEPDMAALDRLGEQFDTLFVGPPLGH